MEAPGFEKAPILTYLMRRRRCRDSYRPRSCTNKFLRARSGMLVVLGDPLVRVGDGDGGNSYDTKSKSETMLGGVLEIHGIPSHSPAALHSTHDGGAWEQVVRR